MAFEDGVDRLVPTALALVSLAIVVAIGTVVLTTMQPIARDTVAVTDESATPGTPFPTNYTVAQATGNADFVTIEDGSVTVDFNDTSAGTVTTLTQGTDYTVYNDAGNIEFLNTTATSDYDSATDEFLVDYTSEETGSGTAVFGTAVDSLGTFADFFAVLVIVAVATVLFLLLRVVRRNGMA